MTRLFLDPAPFARSLHVSPRLGVIYVNNPKVACSTIKLTLQQAELGDPSYQPATSVHDRAVSPLLTAPEITGQEDAALANRFVFSFVRHPCDRLKSAYLNKIVRPQKQGNFRVQAGFDRGECPSFRDFVLSVCRQEPRQQNPHWRVQALNLSMDKINYSFIGRLEWFKRDWAYISKVTGLPAVPAQAGKKTDSKLKNDLSLDDEMLTLVFSRYEQDFAQYGYEFAP